MRLEQLELLVVELPLVTPFETSFWRCETITHLVVRAHVDGLVGYGECAVDVVPAFGPETIKTCLHVLGDFLGPAVLGRELDGADALLAALPPLRGHRVALGGLEMAVWDLAAAATETPLCRLLGGEPRPVPVGVSIGLQASIGELIDTVAAHVASGYRRVKIKIKPGHDVKPLAALREQFPDLALAADANASYTLGDLDALRPLDALGLTMIEQPLADDDIVDHAALQRQLATAICLDESVRSADDGRRALGLGACRIVNVKPGRVGGLRESVRLHDVCRAQGVPVWCGGMLELGIGRAHNLALATLPGFTLPSDLSESRRYFHADVIDPPVTMSDGFVSVPDRPGRGYAIDEERLEAAVVRRELVA